MDKLELKTGAAKGRLPTKLDSLAEGLYVQVVEQIRSWTFVEDDEERVEMRT